jgi:hypothetical protein
MTHILQNEIDTWSFQAAGTAVYVTQTRRAYVTPKGNVITNQVMHHCSYGIAEARRLWSLLVETGAKEA